MFVLCVCVAPAQKVIIKLKYEVESVCMTLHDEQNAYAVGSRSYVTMVDPRDRKNKLYIQSPQQRAGAYVRACCRNASMKFA